MRFHHVMLYVTDIARGLEFWVDRMGFHLIEGSIEMGYARLRVPQGDSTLALHRVEEGGSVEAPGIRLYFESDRLDDLCRELAGRGVVFDSMPADEPWGWRHAYLRDPDGHELSLYYAGRKRLSPSA